MINKALVITVISFTFSFCGFAQAVEEHNNIAPVAQPSLYSLRRLVSVAPLAFSENGVGFAVSYEQNIDRQGIVAFQLPLLATFNVAKNNAANGYKNDPMVYFIPGIKFYPTGSYGPMKYAIGPSLLLGVGSKSTYNNGSYPSEGKFVLGIILDNSLNMFLTPRFYLGFNLGFGFSYINILGENNKGVTGLAQGSFKLGYRFQ